MGARGQEHLAQQRDGRGRLVLIAIGVLAMAGGRRRRRGQDPERRTTETGGARGRNLATPDRPYTVSGIDEPPRWRSRWAFYAVGAAMMAWGLYGLLTTASTKPLNWATFFIGGAVAHDLVFVPLIALVVVLGLHLVPAAYRSYAQAGVLGSGLLILVALPMLVSPGRPDDPSTLPLPYGRNLLLLLALAWLAVLATAAAGLRRRRSSGPALANSRAGRRQSKR